MRNGCRNNLFNRRLEAVLPHKEFSGLFAVYYCKWGPSVEEKSLVVHASFCMPYFTFVSHGFLLDANKNHYFIRTKFHAGFQHRDTRQIHLTEPFCIWKAKNKAVRAYPIGVCSSLFPPSTSLFYRIYKSALKIFSRLNFGIEGHNQDLVSLKLIKNGLMF